MVFYLHIHFCAQYTFPFDKMVYIRYIHEGDLKEEFLFCVPLQGHTTGADIFKEVNEFFSANDILWADLLACCVDGAPGNYH